MRGHPLSRHPFELQSNLPNSNKNHVHTNSYSSLHSNLTVNNRSQSSTKIGYSIGPAKFLKQNLEVKSIVNHKNQKARTHTKVTEASNITEPIEEFKRLNEKAGYTESIDLNQVQQKKGQGESGKQKTAEQIKKEIQKQVSSGYGLVKNPFPQYLLPQQQIDFSNLANIGRYWSQFEGSFLKGNKSGPGNIYLTNGSLFSGYFENDLANGKGAVYVDGELRIKGCWKNNMLCTKF